MPGRLHGGLDRYSRPSLRPVLLAHAVGIEVHLEDLALPEDLDFRRLAELADLPGGDYLRVLRQRIGVVAVRPVRARRELLAQPRVLDDEVAAVLQALAQYVRLLGLLQPLAELWLICFSFLMNVVIMLVIMPLPSCYHLLPWWSSRGLSPPCRRSSFFVISSSSIGSQLSLSAS